MKRKSKLILLQWIKHFLEQQILCLIELSKQKLVQKEIQKGGISFETAARENSACPSGKRSGGDLGWFLPEDMVIEFSTACQSIPKGEMGLHPIVTEFGVHIIYRTG